MDQAALREVLARGYAAGALDPALMLLAETQAAMSPPQHRALREAEALAAGLFEREIGVAVSPDMLARTLAAIDATPPKMPAVAAPMIGGALGAEVQSLPAPLRDAALQAAAGGARWRRALPGLRLLRLVKTGAADIDLARIQPGFGVPTHGHAGEEYILVVAGAYHDGHARYGAGDVAISDSTVTHRPIAERGETCYALLVTVGRLRFHGVFGALQKLARK